MKEKRIHQFKHPLERSPSEMKEEGSSVVTELPDEAAKEKTGQGGKALQKVRSLNKHGIKIYIAFLLSMEGLLF